MQLDGESNVTVLDLKNIAFGFGLLQLKVKLNWELLNQSLYYGMNGFTNGISTPLTLLYSCVGTTECIKQVPGFLLAKRKISTFEI